MIITLFSFSFDIYFHILLYFQILFYLSFYVSNNKLDEYFIKKQNIKFKEVSCDYRHTELPRYDSNEAYLTRTLSLTQPPEYESPKKYEPPPSYVKTNTLNTFGNTLNNTFARLTRGKSPPYTESGGKNNKKKSRKIKKRKSKKTSKRKSSRKN